jgi:5-methylcytosine-specific restriction enzyme subunit McrC
VKIPVQNVYFLLLYAWDHLGEGQEVAVAGHEHTRLQDLFAHVLAETAARLLHRGLDRGYLSRDEAVRGVRGKLDLGATLKRNLLVQAQTHCHFDELTYDVLHNRILKSTLRALLAAEVAGEIRSKLRVVYRKMDAVSDVRVTSRDFGRVQLHRNNRLYDFALRLCRLIHDNLMIEPGSGEARFRDFRSDEAQMGAVFEEFARAFFRREQSRFRVSSPHVAWFRAEGADADLGRLPTMRTDIVLEAPDRCIVLDTKFYSEPLASRYGAKKVRSAHLYQVLTYLHNLAAHRAGGPPHEGMLLYPVVDEAFSFHYRLDGRAISVRSVNLDQPWPRVHDDMLGLLRAA